MAYQMERLDWKMILDIEVFSCKHLHLHLLKDLIELNHYGRRSMMSRKPKHIYFYILLPLAGKTFPRFMNNCRNGCVKIGVTTTTNRR